jgi:hypothetical protein
MAGFFTFPILENRMLNSVSGQYAVPAHLQDELLDNDMRMLAPQSPFHPLFDDVRHDMLRDWQVE